MGLYNDLADSHPKLSRGQVWCTTCGRMKRVNPGWCIAYGWPMCCGNTMTIDSPEERKAAASAMSAVEEGK